MGRKSLLCKKISKAASWVARMKRVARDLPLPPPLPAAAASAAPQPLLQQLAASLQAAAGSSLLSIVHGLVVGLQGSRQLPCLLNLFFAAVRVVLDTPSKCGAINSAQEANTPLCLSAPTLQWHRLSSGTPASAESMCLPHPTAKQGRRV